MEGGKGKESYMIMKPFWFSKEAEKKLTNRYAEVILLLCNSLKLTFVEPADVASGLGPSFQLVQIPVASSFVGLGNTSQVP